MAFVSDYWHALDKETAERLEVSAKDIGISHGAGDVLDGLQANIRAGASAVELGFTGTGKGNLGGGQTNPEMFGKDKREAMRQLSKINEVVVSTHASIGVQGISGLDPKENAFTPQASENVIHEIERTVDFAADVAGGGPVVIHGAEFPREVSEKYKEFEMYEEEAKKTPIWLVNKRTGRIETGLTKDSELPILDKYKEGPQKGEPVYDEEKHEFKITMMNLEQFQKEEGIKDTQKAALEFYKQKILAEQLSRISAEEMRWKYGYEKEKGDYDYMRDSSKMIQDLKKTNEPLAKFQAIQLLKEVGGAPPQKSEKYLEFLEDPFRYLGKTLQLQESHIKQLEESAASYAQQRKMIEKQRDEIQPIEEYGKIASAKNLARAAIYAYDTEEDMKLKKPLFIAPENLFPETGYGSHPQELKEVITDARKEMTNRLVKDRNMSESEAKKIAEDHIKATFDIGHAYTWKKYFKREAGETREHYEERFNDWLLDEVDSLAKKGIIGHVHISDNFGYYDEHLMPGEGSAPLKGFIKKLRKADLTTPMIAEPGAQAQDQFYTAMTGAWGALATSPIYRSFKWTDIEDSYFGRTRSPGYIVGKYAPSEEYRGIEKGTPFWSGVGLE